MFEKFQQFLNSLSSKEDESALTRQDPRVAASALFFHIIEADGVVEPVERERLRGLLKDAYDLDPNDLDELFEAGRKADGEAVDLYGFTSVLKRNLSEERRVEFIELMWELVYADGIRHELEDHVLWRISDLLGVSGRDRVLARQRVEARRGDNPSFTTDKGDE